MLQRLLLLLFLLIIGGIIGYKDLISQKVSSKLGEFQLICLFLLLFIMGIKVGYDKQIINSLFTIGFKALIITLFAVIFSVLFVKIARMVLKL